MTDAAPVATSAGSASSTAASDLESQLAVLLAEGHRTIEVLPLSQALLNGRVTLQRYRVLLADLAVVQTALERRLDEDGMLGELCVGPLVKRGAALTADLTFWGAPETRESPAAQRLADWLALCPIPDVIGAAYVIAGSCFRAAVIAPRLARAFNIPCTDDNGIDYLCISSTTLMPAWLALRERVVEHSATYDDGAEIANGAQVMLEGLSAIFSDSRG